MNRYWAVLAMWEICEDPLETVSDLSFPFPETKHRSGL